MFHQIRWTQPKLAARLRLIEPLAYRRRLPLPAFRFLPLASPSDLPPVSSAADDSSWSAIPANTYWERADVNFVLRTTFQVPTNWDASAAVALYLPLGDPGSFSHPEALAYLDGSAYGTCDRHHQEIILPAGVRDGQPHLLALHGWTGNWNKDGDFGRLLMNQCELVQIDRPTRDFIAAARVALDAADKLDPHHPAKERLLNALDAAFKTLDTREPFGDAFYASVPAAHDILRQGIEAAGAPLDVHLVAAGHAHIDVAWLWTLGQTRRKAGRTFTNVIRLMEQFPNYHFTQSQPQLYEFVRQDYPELFEAIKQRVADRRWEIIGGMWIEADCNVSGGESLARQFLLGRTFFRQHFGAEAESPVLWLPDVFGYAWSLPQLIRLAGMEYFFTIKIGWSQYNRLPYDSFWWQGLDGTRVLTHFSTTPDPGNLESNATYNAMPTPGTALSTWRRFQQKHAQTELLVSYGYGDGGGGPNREMLENIREMASFPGLPRVRTGRVGDFFRSMEEQAGDRLPTWNGELYLELHRGTYTSQSRSKRANRKSEFLLHDAEFTAALAALLDTEYVYPANIFHQAWELVCLNQFHDILPGSSIGAVYEESLQQYDELQTAARAALHDALAAIARTTGGDVLLVNPTSFARADLALWPGKLAEDQHLETPDGRSLPTQSTENGTWIGDLQMQPYSALPLRTAPGAPPPPAASVTASSQHLENDYLRVEFDAGGDIVRIYDKANGREVLPANTTANQFQAFEDRPYDWDAWDVFIYYDDKMWTAQPAESVRVVEAGPLRATLEIKRQILNSAYTQRISLACNSPRLDFDTHIDWRERHILLKTAFPVEALASAATYEIQWGNVQRPTHRNTSWDWARFETCAQKWVDLSEGNWGVSLLNDCKYGHDIHDQTMRISLLRSSTSPDTEADQGEHRFCYSLLPHSGNWEQHTAREAYALNDPIIAVNGEGRPINPETLQSLISPAYTPANQNIIIETIKRAEDGIGLIVRLYEYRRQRGPVTLTTGFKLGAAFITNLLEENQEEIAIGDHHLTIPVRPYQIITLRLIPAAEL